MTLSTDDYGTGTVNDQLPSTGHVWPDMGSTGGSGGENQGFDTVSGVGPALRRVGRFHRSGALFSERSNAHSSTELIAS